MKTFTGLKNLFTNLSNNVSAANSTLGGQLINDQHRYLIQKYFDNERTSTTSTVGGQSLTLTATLSIAAVSATLTASWAYPTGYQLVNFSGAQQRNVLFTNGSTAITWAVGLTATATTAISSLGFQYYSIPANISKIKDNTINVGQLKYTIIPVSSQQEWDLINFLPYNSDIPQYAYIFGGTLGIFPIPSTTGNILTFNYKSRVADLSFNDYSTGNITTETAGSTSIVGTATSWSATGAFPTGMDLTYFNLNLVTNPPFGDGLYYPIRQFGSDTTLTLALPIVNAPNITASSTYTIGQVPLLSEDFHDMLVYGALMTYFNSTVKDESQYKVYKEMYDDRLELLEQYAGTKFVNVDLQAEPMATNANLFYFAQ